MDTDKINEQYLLLLIIRNNFLCIDKLNIDNHFQNEQLAIDSLCSGYSDNINQIISYINSNIASKIPNKIYNYCEDLSKAFKSVHINIKGKIEDIILKRDLIYTNQQLANDKNESFDIDENFLSFKAEIKKYISLWFKAFNIDLAYEKTKTNKDILVYSHRMSGWKKPSYQITKNLKLEIKTNFGYGSVSYFYSILTYKGIIITPLSEWTDYRYSNFSEINRYTKRFGLKISKTSGNKLYHTIKIENKDWFSAIAFTEQAGNISITDEEKFIEKYIIQECEYMVNGLQYIYENTDFELIDEDKIDSSIEKAPKYKLSVRGYELIDFKTEKIIGALDFLNKIIEYNELIPTKKYLDKIVELTTLFIPNVHKELDNIRNHYNLTSNDYKVFTHEHNIIIEKFKFYENEKIKLKEDFNSKYYDEYLLFYTTYTNSIKDNINYTIKLKQLENNILKLTSFNSKYESYINTNIL